jgi:hypothetical protein
MRVTFLQIDRFKAPPDTGGYTHALAAYAEVSLHPRNLFL